ncbi:MAG: hypothetical protein ABI696_00435 [Rubrivivax sp.]
MPAQAVADRRKLHIDTTISLGRYLVSPLTRRLDDGRFSAGVSIRSGQGHGTHDRVLRFVPDFDTPQAALLYARREAVAWLRGTTAVA